MREEILIQQNGKVINYLNNSNPKDSHFNGFHDEWDDLKENLVRDIC